MSGKRTALCAATLLALWLITGYSPAGGQPPSSNCDPSPGPLAPECGAPSSSGPFLYSFLVECDTPETAGYRNWIFTYDESTGEATPVCDGIHQALAAKGCEDANIISFSFGLDATDQAREHGLHGLSFGSAGWPFDVNFGIAGALRQEHHLDFAADIFEVPNVPNPVALPVASVKSLEENDGELPTDGRIFPAGATAGLFGGRTGSPHSNIPSNIIGFDANDPWKSSYEDKFYFTIDQDCGQFKSTQVLAYDRTSHVISVYRDMALHGPLEQGDAIDALSIDQLHSANCNPPQSPSIIYSLAYWSPSVVGGETVHAANLYQHVIVSVPLGTPRPTYGDELRRSSWANSTSVEGDIDGTQSNDPVNWFPLFKTSGTADKVGNNWQQNLIVPPQFDRYWVMVEGYSDEFVGPFPSSVSTIPLGRLNSFDYGSYRRLYIWGTSNGVVLNGGELWVGSVPSLAKNTATEILFHETGTNSAGETEGVVRWQGGQDPQNSLTETWQWYVTVDGIVQNPNTPVSMSSPNELAVALRPGAHEIGVQREVLTVTAPQGVQLPAVLPLGQTAYTFGAAFVDSDVSTPNRPPPPTYLGPQASSNGYLYEVTVDVPSDWTDIQYRVDFDNTYSSTGPIPPQDQYTFRFGVDGHGPHRLEIIGVEQRGQDLFLSIPREVDVYLPLPKGGEIVEVSELSIGSPINSITYQTSTGALVFSTASGNAYSTASEPLPSTVAPAFGGLDPFHIRGVTSWPDASGGESLFWILSTPGVTFMVPDDGTADTSPLQPPPLPLPLSPLNCAELAAFPLYTWAQVTNYFAWIQAGDLAARNQCGFVLADKTELSLGIPGGKLQFRYPSWYELNPSLGITALGFPIDFTQERFVTVSPWPVEHAAFTHVNDPTLGETLLLPYQVGNETLAFVHVGLNGEPVAGVMLDVPIPPVTALTYVPGDVPYILAATYDTQDSDSNTGYDPSLYKIAAYNGSVRDQDPYRPYSTRVMTPSLDTKTPLPNPPSGGRVTTSIPIVVTEHAVIENIQVVLTTSMIPWGSTHVLLTSPEGTEVVLDAFTSVTGPTPDLSIRYGDRDQHQLCDRQSQTPLSTFVGEGTHGVWKLSITTIDGETLPVSHEWAGSVDKVELLIKKAQSEIPLGDVNGDGVVDAADHDQLAQFILDNLPLVPNDSTGVRCLASYDVNGDGLVNADDYADILSIPLGATPDLKAVSNIWPGDLGCDF